MPPASGNSVIIGAACYSPKGDDDILHQFVTNKVESDVGKRERCWALLFQRAII